MPAWLSTSSAAPVTEMFRTAQSMCEPPKAMVPAFKTRCRRWRRLSSREASIVTGRILTLVDVERDAELPIDPPDHTAPSVPPFAVNPEIEGEWYGCVCLET